MTNKQSQLFLLQEIYQSISSLYGFDNFTIEALVEGALGRVYNGVGPAVIDKDGGISILVESPTSKELIIKTFILSSLNKKKFKKELSDALENESKTRFRKSLRQVLKKSKGFLFCSYAYSENGFHFFKIFDIYKREIPNAFLYSCDKDLLKVKYIKDRLYLFTTTHRPEIISKDYKHYIIGYNNTLSVLGNLFNRMLNKFNTSVDSSIKYSYKSIFYDLKRECIVVQLNNTFISPIAASFFKQEFLNQTGCSLILLTNITK